MSECNGFISGPLTVDDLREILAPSKGDRFLEIKTTKSDIKDAPISLAYRIDGDRLTLEVCEY